MAYRFQSPRWIKRQVDLAIIPQRIHIVIKYLFTNLNWRSSVKVGLATSITIAVVNVVFILIALARGQSKRMQVYRDTDPECTNMKRVSIVIDLYVNAAGTLTLGSSSAAFQVLTAPTRRDVDRAQARGDSLHIGVSSLKNLTYMPGLRRLLCLLLMIGSLPLHLLFNAAFIPTSYSTNYVAAIVDERFYQGKEWIEPWREALSESLKHCDSAPAHVCNRARQDQSNNNTEASDYGHGVLKNQEAILDLQGSVHGLSYLNNADCINAFNTDVIQGYLGVIVVVQQVENSTSPMYDAWRHNTIRGFGNGWICGKRLDGYAINCIIPDPAKQEWAISWVDLKYGWHTEKVKACYAKPFAHSSCTIEVIPGFLIAVVVGILFTIIPLIVLLRMRHFAPLVTTGDALVSFIKSPKSDRTYPATEECSSQSERCYLDDPKHWIARRRRLYTAAKKGRWIGTFLLCFCYWAGILGLFVDLKATNHHKLAFSKLWRNGLSNPSSANFIQKTQGFNLTRNALLVNTPQLILSTIYLCYNSLLTHMLAAQEYASYTTKRKGLRVSEPKGDQRSTYWLSLPLRFGVPLMILSWLLHWLMSQSLFLTQLAIYSEQEDLRPPDVITCLTWSAMGMTLQLVVFGVGVMLLPPVLGALKGKSLMPLCGHDSAMIRRACRSRAGIRGEEEKRLMFGAVKGVKGCGLCGGSTGFSAGVVEILREDEKYE